MEDFRQAKIDDLSVCVFWINISIIIFREVIKNIDLMNHVFIQ